MSIKSIKYDDICDKCAHAEYCDMATFGGHNPKITACCKFTERHQTNGDCIRSMTDDELAVWIAARVDCGECKIYSRDCMASAVTCACRWRDWLKQGAT